MFDGTGLVMAGGRGSRMRASGVTVPKALVPVGGVTLLERNLHQLVRAGARDVAVAVSTAVPEVVEHARTRLAWVAEAAGVRLRVLEEAAPLGNIGPAAALREDDRPVLVVYADNVTTLDLTRALRRHDEAGADLTLAAHREPFRMPYGELVVDGGEVVSYVEKPVRPVLVASAVCVLSPGALGLLPVDRPTGLSELFGLVRADGRRVVALEHEAAWVDVNDSTALERAEAVVAEHPAVFDQWAGTGRPVTRVVLAVRDGHVRLEPDAEGAWTLPALDGSGTADPQAVLDLPEASPAGPRITRYEVVVAGEGSADDLDGAGRWWPLCALPSRVSGVVPWACRRLGGRP